MVESTRAMEMATTPNNFDQNNDKETNYATNTAEIVDVEINKDADVTALLRYCNEKHVTSALQTLTLALTKVVSEIQEPGTWR